MKRVKGGSNSQEFPSLEVIYNRLLSRKASKNQLNEQGYPRPSDTCGVAEFRNGKDPYNYSKMKTCRRCRKNFFQRKSERPKGGRCTYHHGKCFDDTWQCCKKSKFSKGCMTADTHVHNDNVNNRDGYVKTGKKDGKAGSNPQVFAVDCEMLYTVNGLELARVSIVDHTYRVLYDTYVQPYGEILCHNTAYSGITKRHLEGVTTSLADVQNFLLENIAEDTILIGHSLESDLVALRLIHETVVDTSLVFIHPKGLPVKYALKTLAKKELGKTVQSRGHDSVEDASICMHLMLQQIVDE